MIIADTDAEAMALWANSGQFTGNAWFEPFGFRRGLQDPRTGRFLPRRRRSGRAMCWPALSTRSPAGLEANMKRQQVDWMFCYTYNALIPHATLIKSIERF